MLISDMPNGTEILVLNLSQKMPEPAELFINETSVTQTLCT